MGLVGAENRVGAAHCHDPPAIEPQRHVAKLPDVILAVGAEQDGAPVVAERGNALDALLLEVLVADCERLVDDQDIGFNCGHQGERQAHHHPGRIGLDRPVDGLTKFGKVDDLLLESGHLCRRDPDQSATEAQVVTATEVGMETGSQFEYRGDPADALDFAGRGPEGSRHKLEQRALAGSVVADESHALAAVQVERNVLQRPVAVVVHSAHQQRFQPLSRRVIEVVFLT